MFMALLCFALLILEISTEITYKNSLSDITCEKENAHSNAWHSNFLFRLNLKLIYLYIANDCKSKSCIRLGQSSVISRLSKPFAMKRVTFKTLLFLLILFPFLSNFKWCTHTERLEKRVGKTDMLKADLVAETEMNIQNPFKRVQRRS